MAYYFNTVGGVNSSPGSESYDLTESVLGYERTIELNANAIIRRESNLSNANPFRSPHPRTLFYDAGFRSPGKYGQFLFYAFGNNENNFLEQYYQSESGQYNFSISSKESKNPTAASLVREAAQADFAVRSGEGRSSDRASSIVGGIGAPYN